MKINQRSEFNDSSSNLRRDTIKLWEETARKISLEYGIYCEVKFSYYNNNFEKASRIYFLVMEKECDSLKELIRLLDNKAFI